MTNRDEPSDGALVARVLGGEAAAFEILVNRYGPRLIGLGFHLTGDYDVANDVAQEALVTAYERLDRLNDPEAFGAWTAGILRNKVRNLGRKNPASTVSLDALHEVGFDPPDQRQATAGDREAFDITMQAILNLPEKYREVLILRFFEDMSYKEMAEFLDLPVTTVTTRLNYGRQKVIDEARQMGIL